MVDTQKWLTFDCDPEFLSKFQGWWDHQPIRGVAHVLDVTVSNRQRHPIRIQVQQFLSPRSLSTEILVAMKTVFFFCRNVNALCQLKRNCKKGKQKKLQSKQSKFISPHYSIKLLGFMRMVATKTINGDLALVAVQISCNFYRLISPTWVKKQQHNLSFIER